MIIYKQELNFIMDKVKVEVVYKDNTTRYLNISESQIPSLLRNEKDVVSVNHLADSSFIVFNKKLNKLNVSEDRDGVHIKVCNSWNNPISLFKNLFKKI